jgi:osmotically-inducible protein OsmY
MAYWIHPESRYYYPWYDKMPAKEMTDAEIKDYLVERLHLDPATADETIRVDVKRSVVILTGAVSSALAKRAAGDDAWDTSGVVDVSNQLVIGPLDDTSEDA